MRYRCESACESPDPVGCEHHSARRKKASLQQATSGHGHDEHTWLRSRLLQVRLGVDVRIILVRRLSEADGWELYSRCLTDERRLRVGIGRENGGLMAEGTAFKGGTRRDHNAGILSSHPVACLPRTSLLNALQLRNDRFEVRPVVPEAGIAPGRRCRDDCGLQNERRLP